MTKHDKTTQALIDALWSSSDKQIIDAFKSVAKACKNEFPLHHLHVVLKKAAKELKAAD